MWANIQQRDRERTQTYPQCRPDKNTTAQILKTADLIWWSFLGFFRILWLVTIQKEKKSRSKQRCRVKFLVLDKGRRKLPSQFKSEAKTLMSQRTYPPLSESVYWAYAVRWKTCRRMVLRLKPGKKTVKPLNKIVSGSSNPNALLCPGSFVWFKHNAAPT